jgi:hypothetical protein
VASELVERVARAILDALGDQYGCGWDRCACSGAADTLECKMHVTEHDLALVAIAVMREPTEAMAEAGDLAARAEGAHDCEVPMSDVWKSMIDAGLAE